MEQFKAWWNEASSRDQLSLVALAIAVLLYVLFYFILTPVSEMRAAQEQRVASQLAAYDRVKNLASQWKQAQSAGENSGRSATIEQQVERSFSQHGLRVSGFDASGRSGIRVRFDSVSYEKFVAWLHDLEVVQGLKMKDVSVAATPTPGSISASILVQKN